MSERKFGLTVHPRKRKKKKKKKRKKEKKRVKEKKKKRKEKFIKFQSSVLTSRMVSVNVKQY